MAKARELKLTTTEGESPTEPSSKRKKRDTRPAEHIKTLHEAWLKACAPEETRKLYSFLMFYPPDVAGGESGGGHMTEEFILATSERAAVIKRSELQQTVTRVTKPELAKRMAFEMSLFAERQLGAPNGNQGHNEPAGLAPADPEPEARKPVQGSGGKGPSGDVPF
jgi:hypothetical protein